MLDTGSLSGAGKFSVEASGRYPNTIYLPLCTKRLKPETRQQWTTTAELRLLLDCSIHGRNYSDCVMLSRPAFTALKRTTGLALLAVSVSTFSFAEGPGPASNEPPKANVTVPATPRPGRPSISAGSSSRKPLNMTRRERPSGFLAAGVPKSPYSDDARLLAPQDPSVRGHWEIDSHPAPVLAQVLALPPPCSPR